MKNLKNLNAVIFLQRQLYPKNFVNFVHSGLLGTLVVPTESLMFNGVSSSGQRWEGGSVI